MKTPRERAEEMANQIRHKEHLDSTIDGIADTLTPLLEELDAARKYFDETFITIYPNSLEPYVMIRKRNEGKK